MNISSYGKDLRAEYAKEALQGLIPEFSNRIILLPTPSTKDGFTVFESGENLYDLLSELDVGDLVIGYGLPKGFLDIAEEFGIKTLELSAEEEFLKENASLTAIGAIAKIICSEPCCPSELSVGIVGFGRIGGELVKLFGFLGAKITLFTSKKFEPSELCSLGLLGARLLPYETLSEGSDLELCREMRLLINTAPKKIISESFLRGGTPRIIELASGENLPSGVPYERFAAIPGKMFPKSAGGAIAQAAVRLIKSENFGGKA